jgi:hypothetical protein
MRELPGTLFANILRPDSPLISLVLDFSTLHEYPLPMTDDGFAALLSLVEKSKVERLDLGEISGRQKFLTLIASIPKMQMTELQFQTSWDETTVWSSAVVRAVKKNASLRSVEVDYGNFFNESNRRKLNSYAARNAGFPRWIAAPTSIPRDAWPMAIEAARGIGPDAVVRILSVLGSSVGPVEGKRSRKRPLFFSPKW